MEFHIFIAFAAATSIMIALPGPSVILTIAHSISFGWRPAIATVAGETSGVAVQLLIAAVGFVSILNYAAQVFECIRWVGAVYLIYLGIKQWKSVNNPIEIHQSKVSKKNLFAQGLIITIPNPKCLLFIAAFLPQFIDPARPVSTQFSIIVPTFLILTFTITSVWALAADSARVFLGSRKSIRAVSKTSGGLMVLAGIGLAAARRNN